MFARYSNEIGSLFFQTPYPKHSRRFSMVFDRETETQTLLSIAIDGYLRELGLKDSDRHLLEGEIEFRDAEPGVTLLRESYAEVSQSFSN